MLFRSGYGTLCGGDGDDTLIVKGYNNSIEGGNGSDTVDYSNAKEKLYLLLYQSAQAYIGDTLVSIENAIGSKYNDLIWGSAGKNLLRGNDGNDTLMDQAGNDTMYGEAGNDLLSDNDGWDYLNGGEGHDTLYGGYGYDTLLGGSGDDFLRGGAEGDRIDGGDGIDTADYSTSYGWVQVDLRIGAQVGGSDGLGGPQINSARGDTLVGIENLTGSNYDDVLIGDDGANVLSGLEGNDTLTAGVGDTVRGGAGSDALLSSDAALNVTTSTHIQGVERDRKSVV